MRLPSSNDYIPSIAYQQVDKKATALRSPNDRTTIQRVKHIWKGPRVLHQLHASCYIIRPA